MKIVLIMPRSKLYQKGRGFKKNLRYAPLTLTTLASMVPDEMDADIRIIDEGVELVDYSSIDADLVGITCITGSSHRAYEISKSFRERGITVVLGGPHPTLLPEEAKENADSVVVGLANKTWPELLYDFRDGKLKEMYKDSDKTCLKNMPHPRRDLLKKRDYITINTIQATYGCPYKCDFCVVQNIRKGYYHRPIDEVIDEIKNMKSKLIFFLDSSPIENKEYIKELYRRMIPLKIKWMGLSTVRITEDEELFDLAVKSGCSGLLIGFESVSKKSLKKLNKGFNDVDKYSELIRRLHDKNIAIMGCFVFGSDDDDKTVFKETVDFIIENGIDLPRFTAFTPFPGTKVFNRLKGEGRILTENWSKYNAQNVVFEPKNMSKEELEDGLKWAWEESYKTKNIAKRLLKSRSQLLYLIVANIGYQKYAGELPIFK